MEIMHAFLMGQSGPVQASMGSGLRHARPDAIRMAHGTWLLPLVFVVHAAWAVISIGAGRDVLFGEGSRAIFFSYRPAAQHWVYFAGGWRGQYHDEVYGAGYHCGLGRLSIELGASYLTELNDINGTHWNFATHVAYRLGHHWALSYRHFSNADFIFHWSAGPNRGWNFVSIDYLFDRGKRSAQKTCIP